MPKTSPTDSPPRPRIEVLERRLQNPFGEPSSPITMKDAALECRWFNADVANDHVWRAKRKGWTNVRPEHVLDTEQIGGFSIDTAGNIVRGERGREVLLAMPKEWRTQIELAKVRANTKNMGNPAATKAEIIEAAGRQLGDETASFMEKQGRITGGVRDTVERVERVEE